MSKLFRQSAIDKLQSPEQLDKMIIVTKPSTWIAIVGLAFIIVAALIWSIFGTIPSKITGDGIFLDSSKVTTVYEENENEKTVVLYLPLSEGKSVEVGMSVRIHPSTVAEEEYGHMEGEIVYVDEYVATEESMKSVLREDSLVDTFLQNGAVVTVVCSLRTDEKTESGYYWSAQKGAEVVLREGTPVSADIITDERAPISLLLPIFKGELQISGGTN